ncbi:uncharacterized protein BCR38DRAFT_482031 [Pseudomassariella vexata]|uniref:Uncharacterized protein n=1 Tax=Pseudomassariella vexata TaxID=1141098 RepID=A0A1Y2ECI8_9PEZI|nr:uncharacterized protein BCR38DRAFT_482031 [Pseudomassariella vexata]ORY68545.1 hypothetical protein BCR38DRAFT_482031 [Pseudomassariella vexata]
MPIGAITGGTVGGVIVLALLGFLLFFWCRRKGRENNQADQMEVTRAPQPLSPYKDLFASTPTIANPRMPMLDGSTYRPESAMDYMNSPPSTVFSFSTRDSRVAPHLSEASDDWVRSPEQIHNLHAILELDGSDIRVPGYGQRF